MTVRIEPPNGDGAEQARIAAILLDAAADPNDVKVVTDGQGLAFEVPDELAQKVKLNTDDLRPETEEASKGTPAEPKKKKKGE